MPSYPTQSNPSDELDILYYADPIFRGWSHSHAISSTLVLTHAMITVELWVPFTPSRGLASFMHPCQLFSMLLNLHYSGLQRDGSQLSLSSREDRLGSFDSGADWSEIGSDFGVGDWNLASPRGGASPRSLSSSTTSRGGASSADGARDIFNMPYTEQVSRRVVFISVLRYICRRSRPCAPCTLLCTLLGSCTILFKVIIHRCS